MGIGGGSPSVSAPPPPPPPPPAPPTMASANTQQAGLSQRLAATSAAGMGFNQTLLTSGQGAATPDTAKEYLGQ